MKSVILATAIAMTSTAAFAADGSLLPIPVMGSVEYAVEAETTSFDLGTYIGIGNFGVSPLANFSDTSGSFDFDGAEVTATYMFGSNVDLYATIEADADFEYTEATVGVAFAF
jgi:hypothetical protein